MVLRTTAGAGCNLEPEVHAKALLGNKGNFPSRALPELRCPQCGWDLEEMGAASGEDNSQGERKPHGIYLCSRRLSGEKWRKLYFKNLGTFELHVSETGRRP